MHHYDLGEPFGVDVPARNDDHHRPGHAVEKPCEDGCDSHSAGALRGHSLPEIQLTDGVISRRRGDGE
ncbi:MAG: hypothetical protein GEU90_06790 [Gemmatimonas sp.]|nr:hypothetical protein [Gemmatimonas sp.]